MVCVCVVPPRSNARSLLTSTCLISGLRQSTSNFSTTGSPRFAILAALVDIELVGSGTEISLYVPMRNSTLATIAGATGQTTQTVTPFFFCLMALSNTFCLT